MRSRIVVFFTLLLVGVQAVAFLSINATILNIATQQNIQDLRVGERIFNRLLAQNRHKLLDSAAVLSADYAFRKAVATQESGTSLSVLNNHGARIGANVMMLASLHNELLADTLHPSATSRPSPLGPLIQAAQSQGNASSIMLLDGQAYQMVLVPVLAPDPIAWVAMGFVINNKLANELKALTGLEVSFLTKGGERHWTVLAATPPPGLRQALLNSLEAGSVRPTDSNDLKIGGYETLVSRLEQQSGISVIAVLQRSIADAMKPLARLRVTLGSLMLCSLALSLVGAMFIARRVTVPIARLVRATRQLAETKQYSLRVAKQDDDELGVLVDGFNNMLTQIQKRDDELEYHRNNLEQEVTTRTEELLKAKDAAEAASRAKSHFLAKMSHEIRTPMNGVLGMSDILLRSTVTDRQRTQLNTLHRSAEALLGVINDILDFSKIEAGKLELDHVDFNLHDMVGEVAEILAPVAHNKDIELAYTIAKDVPSVVAGDPTRLRQVLTNLLSNAVQFTSQGEVVVTVSAQNLPDEESQVRFEVRDTGIGITPEGLKRLFEAFTQVHTATTREFGGTGLGLAIAKQLTEMMGGEIGVQSTPGQGSIFYFSARLKQRPTETRPYVHDIGLLANRRALVVDDNATYCAILQDYLQRWQMRVDAATDGRQALTQLHKAVYEGQPYDVTIVEVQMPGMSGIDLAETIRSDPNLVHMRVLMLVSADTEEPPKHAREMGVVAYLTKPARPSHLHRTLCAIMRGISTSNLSNTQQLKQGLLHTAKLDNPASILLAEDNPVNQEVAITMLENLGCSVEIANNGQEAVEAVGRKHYDIVLMDCQMPIMDGYTAAGEIRRREGDQSPARIIALTANAMEGDRERCLAAGMDDYLSKPFSQKELHEMLTRWLSRQASENSPRMGID